MFNYLGSSLVIANSTFRNNSTTSGWCGGWRAQLGVTAFASAWAAGRAQPLEHASAEAMSD